MLIYHIQPGRPTPNAFIERFNWTYRNEVLNLNLLGSLEEVRELTANWMTIYNEQRSHASFQGTAHCMEAPSQPQNSIYDLFA